MLKQATVRAPEGWFLDPSNTPDILAAAATDDDGLQGFGVVAFPGPRVTTDVHVKALLDQNYAKIDYERLPDTYLAGSKVYYLVGRDKRLKDTWDIEIGGTYGDLNYTVGFSLQGKSRAEREALVDSVLASWEWK